MKPVPDDWARISSAIFYDDAGAAIDWLVKTFGFSVQLRIEGDGGRIEHSELRFGDGLIMVASTGERPGRPDEINKSPRSIGGANTQSLCVVVDDADAHFRGAKAAGAKILFEPKVSDYGDDYPSDKTYQVEDLEGHRWWFMERVRGPKVGKK